MISLKIWQIRKVTTLTLANQKSVQVETMWVTLYYTCQCTLSQGKSDIILTSLAYALFHSNERAVKGLAAQDILDLGLGAETWYF